MFYLSLAFFACSLVSMLLHYRGDQFINAAFPFGIGDDIDTGAFPPKAGNYILGVVQMVMLQKVGSPFQLSTSGLTKLILCFCHEPILASGTQERERQTKS